MGFIADAMSRSVEALGAGLRFHPSAFDPAVHGWGWVGSRSHSGVTVTDSAAMRIAAVFSCVRLISGTLAALPLVTYARLPVRGKRRAPEYFLYPLLHDRFNDEQTSMEAREMLQAHLLLRGNAYAAIARDGFGRPTQIVPLHPDHVRPRRLVSGALVYDWSPIDGQKPRTFRQDQREILHLRSLISRDGITGMSVVSMARECFGMSLALEEYGARMFGSGAQFTGMLKYPGRLKPETVDTLRTDFAEKYAGLENAWKPLILEDGMDWVSIGMNAHDAEFLLHRKFQVSDVARWFLVPPHMIGDVEKSTSWGTGIEQQMQGFLNFTMGYWLMLWEQDIKRDLVPPAEAEKYFAEFLVEGLLRADTAARGEFYTKMFNIGAFSQNDILDKENMNPFAGGDKHYVPLNMAPVGTLPQATAPPGAPAAGAAGEPDARGDQPADQG